MAPSWTTLTQHAAQLGALAVGLFLLMKTYSVSNYSLTTASALLTAAPVAVILGTLTSYEYVMWPLLCMASGALAVRLWVRERWSVAFLITAGLTVATGLLSPPLYLALGLLAILAVCLAHALVSRAVTSSHGGEAPAWLPTRYTAVRSSFVLLVLAALVYSLPQAWLPAEIVVFHGAGGERRAVVGHVVSADGVWVTVLRGGDRGLTRLHASDVSTRRVCHLGGAQPKARPPLVLALQGKEYDSPNVGCRKLLATLPKVRLIPGSFPASHPYVETR